MAPSLGLAAYLAYARRASHTAPPAQPPRPDGTLVWIHTADTARLDALADLAARLVALRPGVNVLITMPDTADTTGTQGTTAAVTAELPVDTVPAAEAFLAHWSPDLCLWTGGDLRPALLSCAHERGVPLFLIDAEESRLATTAGRWFPDMTRALLPVFSGFTARSEAGARALRRLGVRDGAISIVGALREGARMLPYNETDRETLAALLRGRPTWLAAAIQPEELPEVLRAYRRVNRLAHRSLLVIVPDDPARGPDFRDALAAGGWRHVVWSEGQMPEETTQILLADTAGELGLWYAVAAITFMGSSLVAGHQGRDPNAPAAHGSAILYGPNVRRHLNTYRRYAEAGAARQVRDAADLAATVQELLPPDRSAAMAHAAWDVASEAAGVTDHIIEMVQESLDEAETP